MPTPSEVVVLHGARFAPPAGRFTASTPALGSDAPIAVVPLAEAVLRAALLGLERGGHLRLEHARPKTLFGLVKRHAVMATVGDADGPSEGHVERALLQSLRALGPTAEVNRVLTDWLAHDRDAPHNDVVREVIEGLREHGLVDAIVEEGRVLLFKTTTTRYVLTDAGRATADAADPAEVQALLDAADVRGELGARLTAEVRQALVARTRQQDTADIGD